MVFAARRCADENQRRGNADFFKRETKIARSRNVHGEKFFRLRRRARHAMRPARRVKNDIETARKRGNARRQIRRDFVARAAPERRNDVVFLQFRKHVAPDKSGSPGEQKIFRDGKNLKKRPTAGKSACAHL